MCRGVGSCLRLAVGFREIGKTFGVCHYCIQSGWKFANIGSYASQKALVVYIGTKTVELLESFTSGSLATKAPLSGQKTQVLISICDKCPWNGWRCDFSRANEAGLCRASGCGQRKTVSIHLAPTIIFDKRYDATVPARTQESGIFRCMLVNFQKNSFIFSSSSLKVTSNRQPFRLWPNENY